jgi:glycosyltransferase involved in cell wall biosynthesis
MEPVTLIGSYPPPYGGLSVHIKRLKAFLERRGTEVAVLADPGSGRGGEGVTPTRLGPPWYLRRLLKRQRGLLHFHTSGIGSLRLIPLSLLALRGRAVVITLHSLRDRFREPLAELPAKALRAFPRVICVGSGIRDQLVERGLPAARLSVIPSYLPPDRTDQDRRSIAPEVDRFLGTHRPILTASAYRLVFFNDQDLYGLDLCIDLCQQLIVDHPQLGFVFALPEIGDEEYFASMQERIAAAGIGAHFCFSRSAAEYWPIIERSSLLVRPTNTDSYGVSVKEAIDLGVPAIASDVCHRPPGAILFPSRDCSSLLATSRAVLANLEEHRAALRRHRTEGGGAGEAILALYREVLEDADRGGDAP